MMSLETVRYAQTYPEEVMGVLLIDGGTPELYSEIPASTAVSHIQRFAINTGIARALKQIGMLSAALQSERNGLKELPDELRELEEKTLLLKGFNRNVTGEMELSKANAVKVTQGKKPLEIPLIALTAGGFGQANETWLDSQKSWETWLLKK